MSALTAALFAISAAASPPNVELEVAARAPIVCVALVVKQVNVAGQVHLTAEVEQTLKGQLSGTLELVPPAEVLPNLEVTRRLLLFLEPTGKPSPSLQIAGQGAAVLWMVDSKNTGTYTVHGARHDEGGIVFPTTMCTTPDDCREALPDLLKQLDLPALAPTKPHSAYYRRHVITCQPCRPELQLKALEGNGAADCGAVNDVSSCLQQAPSFYKAPKIVCDVDHRYDLIHDARGFSEIAFDGLSAKSCHAIATRTPCASVTVRSGERVACIGPGPVQPFCDENPSRVDVLEAAAPLETLQCKLNSLGWGRCEPRSEPDPAMKNARDLVCVPGEGTHLGCHPLR